jgi:hypothetical protein
MSSSPNYLVQSAVSDDTRTARGHRSLVSTSTELSLVALGACSATVLPPTRAAGRFPPRVAAGLESTRRFTHSVDTSHSLLESIDQRRPRGTFVLYPNSEIAER